jgi:hypothetical protein
VERRFRRAESFVHGVVTKLLKLLKGAFGNTGVENTNVSTNKSKTVNGSDLLDKLNRWGEQRWEFGNALVASYEVDRHFLGERSLRTR